MVQYKQKHNAKNAEINPCRYLGPKAYPGGTPAHPIISSPIPPLVFDGAMYLLAAFPPVACAVFVLIVIVSKVVMTTVMVPVLGVVKAGEALLGCTVLGVFGGSIRLLGPPGGAALVPVAGWLVGPGPLLARVEALV